MKPYKYAIVDSTTSYMPRIVICKCDENKNNDINICKELKCGYSLTEAKSEIIKKFAYLINKLYESTTIADINNLLK